MTGVIFWRKDEIILKGTSPDLVQSEKASALKFTATRKPNKSSERRG
jgi:hypothetical protein